VDLTVFVPSGSSLSIETGAGAVDVRGLESDVDARATTGDLAVSTSGSIRAGTHSGSIQAELHGSSWTQVPDFETRTGRISVRFAPGAGALLCASTGGEISVEAPLELEAGADGSLVVVGAGGPRIRLRSEHGDIRIAAPEAGSSRAGDREERP